MCTLCPGHAGVRGKMTDPNKIINWRAMQPPEMARVSDEALRYLTLTTGTKTKDVTSHNRSPWPRREVQKIIPAGYPF